MTVYCITRHYQALDTWHIDEDKLFTNKALCEARLKHLQRRYSEDFEREDSCFVKYSITEKDIILIEDYLFLDILQEQEDLGYERLKNWDPADVE